MEIITAELASGIRYAFSKINSPVAYCAVTIKAGTRDEQSRYNGLAHLTEHMLFKGTNKRGARRINNFLERLGGELNAYTTKEETVIHATILKEDLGKAMELLSDIAFNSLFLEKELLKEREIVLEEIALYKDTPTEQIYDDFEGYLFGNHPLAMPILGTPESVTAIGVEEIKEFRDNHYQPHNMTLSIVADISSKRAASLAERHFSRGVPSVDNRDNGDNGDVGDIAVEQIESAAPLWSGEIYPPKERERREERGTHQSHVVMGAQAYHHHHSKRVPLALLTNILGGPALNSKLNQSLREKHAMAYSVEASYTPYYESGLFSIYFGTDRENLKKCLSLLEGELEELRERALSPTALKSAKKQLLGQLAISMESGEAQALSMGKSLMLYNKIEPIEEIRDKILKIEAEQLQEVAQEILERERLFTLIYQ